MPADQWASAVQLLTGYPMPDRTTLFEDLSGSDGKTPLMNVKIESRGNVAATDAIGSNVGANVDGHSYVLGYYTGSGDSVNLNKISIDFLWDPHSRPARPGTPLDNYIFGSRALLNSLINAPFSSQGQSYGGLVVDPQNSVNLRTFSDIAGAFDRASRYFSDQEVILKQWEDSLHADDAKMQGNAADAFAALIKRMRENYQGYKDQLSPSGFSAKNFALLPVNGNGASLTKQGDGLIGAANAVHQSSYDLITAWHQWGNNPASNPMLALDNIIYDIASWIQSYNLSQVSGSITPVYGDAPSQYSVFATGSYQSAHPTWGDLSQIDTWGNIGKLAVQRWNDAVEAMLAPAGNAQLSIVNNAFIDAAAIVTSPLTTKDTSALGTNQKDGSNDKTDPNKAFEDYLKKNGLDGNNGADGGNDGLNGKDGTGKDGTGKDGPNIKDLPPPTLNGKNGAGNNGLNGPGLDGSGLDGTGQNGTGQDGTSKDGKGPDTRALTMPVPAPQLNGGSGTGNSGLDASGLNLPGLNGADTGTGTNGPLGTDTSGNTTTNGPTTALTHPIPTPQLNAAGLPGVDGLGLGGDSGLGGPGSTDTGTGGPGVVLPGLGGPGTGTGTGTTKIPLPTPSLQGRNDASTVTYPDGSTRSVLPDGSVVTTSADGTKITRSPDGTTVTLNPDGTEITAQPDGTTTTLNPDGSKSVLSPGGTMTLTDPEGHTSYIGPDGKTLPGLPHSTLVNTPAPSLNAPGYDLPGISGADGYHAGGALSGAHAGLSGSDLPSSLSGSHLSGSGLSNPAYEESGYDVSTDFPGYGADSLAGGAGVGLGGPTATGAGGPAPGMMPGMGGAGMGGMGGMGGGAGAGAGTDRVRDFVAAEPTATAARAGQGAGQAGSGMPFMPPGGGQGAGQQTQSSERERANWLAEEEDVWGTEDAGNPAVLGRDDAADTGAQRNAFMTGDN
ncbi:AAWKG family protein [Streptomyces sp. NPDC048297]|uniref:AAWKG family protein n=1 Tax=Streptomyces sp. NPDC048297 TaxID=3365531 RepID=UPI003716C6D6